MSLSTPFIHRPVGTTLLTLAIALAGALAYFFLPVASLPQVEFPTIYVGASLPGASPETMASAVASPLERQFGRIAGVEEMTSTSALGNTWITLQFDLSRNIDGAARDVQAAINAASGQLPSNLPSNPTYHKMNPADAPILILAMTSDTYDRGPMYDAASSILQQKLSQVEGVGQVNVGGSSLPAVRVEVNPVQLNSFGLSMEDVRAVLANANANSPKGAIADEEHTYSLTSSDQLFKAADYRGLIIRYDSFASSPVMLRNFAEVTDSIEDVHTAGFDASKQNEPNDQGTTGARPAKVAPAVMLVIFRQPGANIIDTVDRVRRMMDRLQADIPAGMHLRIAMDRTTTIRASVRDVELTLCLSLALVILVVFIFLRSVRATFIPSIAVPVSIVGTFGVMYLCKYSIDNLSLMALTISTGFVVDDAIVVVENIMRHLEEGMSPMQAALRGAREIGFTVLSISVSLVAVFIPLLLMGGIVGRLFREFAVVLTAAVTLSLIVSLTTTPLMCARLLRGHGQEKHGRIYLFMERIFEGILAVYEWSLARVLRHPLVTLLVTFATIGLTVYLYVIVPKGFFPQQDTGRLMGQVIADQNTSFQRMKEMLLQYAQVVIHNEDVAGADVFVGEGGVANTSGMFVVLRDLGPGPNQRKASADEVIKNLRAQCSQIAGAQLVFQTAQELRIGGRMSAAQYQFTLQADNLSDLKLWAPQVAQAMSSLDGIADVISDQQEKGLSATLVVDRATAARLGITQSAIDNTLYDAFGQRQVSTTFTSLNQYHVVMEANPGFTQGPEALRHIYIEKGPAMAPSSAISTAPPMGGIQVPLSEIAQYVPQNTALAVNHTGQFPSVTISFNLLPGMSLSDAVEEIQDAEHQMGLPVTVHGSFAGTAQAYQASLKNMPFLIAAALLTVYIVLGILYESYIHPLTIISTLPSAGVGALLALLMCNVQLDVMGLIGIILLIGIVKKNAIMLVDFALDSERREGKSPKEAIFQACLLRFRPIIMTTLAALLAAAPLALGTGIGAELRRPLGIAIVGGLICSQALTLYTTPVVYLYLDRLRLFLSGGAGGAEEQRPVR